MRTTELDCQAFRDGNIRDEQVQPEKQLVVQTHSTTSTMSLTMRPTLLPQCTSCLRRISSLGLQEWRNGQQVRGKKKMAHAPTTVTVRLTKDVPTFGRKGTYVPISIGRMRNEFFPTRTAEYVTPAQLKEMKAKNITAERDFQFGVPDPAAIRAIEQQSQRSAKRTVEVEKLAVSLDISSTNVERDTDKARNSPSAQSNFFPCSFLQSWTSDAGRKRPLLLSPKHQPPL